MLFPKNLSVVTLVVLARINDTLVVHSTRKLANSKVDMATLPTCKGVPVFGPFSYRRMTLAEVKAASGSNSPRLVQVAFPLDCLVPLTSNPVYQPRNLRELVMPAPETLAAAA